MLFKNGSEFRRLADDGNQAGSAGQSTGGTLVQLAANDYVEVYATVVGANLDPSHLFWMGADPLIAAEALGDAVYHVHAKDTFLNAPKQATTSLLENGSLMDIPARSWSYITLGFGHGEEWWRQFCYRLKMAGYDGWLSIEHEDVLLNSLEGLEKSVALLQGVMPSAPADYQPQAI